MRNDKNVVSAITNEMSAIGSSIVTPIRIANLVTGASVATMGIWDTGATNTVITRSVAKKLGLTPINITNVRGVHGIKSVNVYFINITLNNENITLNTQVTECDDLSVDDSMGALIGMNIITRGDFAITNFSGKTTMTFRVPSMQKIDFVAGINNKAPIVNDKPTGRNSPCPCGSGKKYKHCCGKNK